MTFKSKLYNISKDLEQHNRDRSTLLQKSIEERLNFALHNYDEEVSKSYSYLSNRGSLRVMRKLNKG